MPLFLRKSLRAGPLRFNLSKSGIGVSTGIPGLRVGLIGPRGHYVYMGRGGVYYRKTLNGGRATAPAPGPPGQPGPSLALTPVLDASQPLLEDVTGATVIQMSASAPSDMVSQLTSSARATPVWQLATVGGLIIAVIAFFAVPPFGGLLLLPMVAGAWWLRQWDLARRAVVAFYDITDEYAQRAEAMVTAFDWLRNTGRRFRAVQAGSTSSYQKKVSAGADAVINKVDVLAALDGPPHLTTNVAVPSLTDSKRSTYFLPDRVLIREGSAFAEVRYDALQCRANQVRWIEVGPVPRDSQQVDTTWRYVNKSGGPDRRFSNNQQLPILLYSELTLMAANGFNETYTFSNPQSAGHFAAALRGMAQPTQAAR